MSDFPKHVTMAQMQAAARALGLDPNGVTHFQVDAREGVTVVDLVRTEDGRPTAVIGTPLHLTRNIPIACDPEARP